MCGVGKQDRRRRSISELTTRSDLVVDLWLGSKPSLKRRDLACEYAGLSTHAVVSGGDSSERAATHGRVPVAPMEGGRVECSGQQRVWDLIASSNGTTFNAPRDRSR